MTEPEAIHSLLLRLVAEVENVPVTLHAAVVYLNGVEILRWNAGEIDVKSRDFLFVLQPRQLRRGTNVLAVEIQKTGRPPGAPWFDLELLANPPSPHRLLEGFDEEARRFLAGADLPVVDQIPAGEARGPSVRQDQPNR